MFDGGWMYANSKIAAARELARRPEAQNNASLQNEICRNYGVILNNMTSDEIAEFERLIKEFAKEVY